MATSTIKGGVDKNISASISASVGSLVERYVYRWGKVVSLTLTVFNSSEVAAGANIFQGTLNTTGLRPVSSSNGVGYIGSRAIVGAIGSNGNIIIRNSSPSALSLTGNLVVHFVYLVE